MSQCFRNDESKATAEGLRKTWPCGCFHGVTQRKVPKFYTEDVGDKKAGMPILDEKGGFVLEMNEELDDGYCDAFSQALHKRQLAVQKLLESNGRPPTEDEVNGLLQSGALPMLGDGNE